MKLLILTFLQFLYGGFTFILPNGIPNAIPNAIPGSPSNGFPNAMMNLPPGFPSFTTITNSTTTQNNTCCFGGSCLSPCPFGQGFQGLPMPFAMPIPQPPRSPVIIPARSYYEPIVHAHPPLHKIQSIIRRDRRVKKNKQKQFESSDYSDTDTDSESTDTDTSLNYYDDFFPVRARRRS